jgi:hypothetical protein
MSDAVSSSASSTTIAADAAPDTGPRHRGGLFAAFVLAVGLVGTLAGAVYLVRNESSPWLLGWPIACAASAAWAGWCILESRIHRGVLPRSHGVLSGALGFDIRCTCRDVATAVFFDPDVAAGGSKTNLLCFLENYASRHRIAHLSIGPHRELGLPEVLKTSLRLAPGEALLQIVPLHLAPTAPTGEHDLSVTLRVEKPAGTGARLPGAYRHLYDLWTLHSAVPFTVAASVARGASSPSSRAEPPRVVRLASVVDPLPRLDRLESALGV